MANSDDLEKLFHAYSPIRLSVLLLCSSLSFIRRLIGTPFVFAAGCGFTNPLKPPLCLMVGQSDSSIPDHRFKLLLGKQFCKCLASPISGHCKRQSRNIAYAAKADGAISGIPDTCGRRGERIICRWCLHPGPVVVKMGMAHCPESMRTIL